MISYCNDDAIISGTQRDEHNSPSKLFTRFCTVELFSLRPRHPTFGRIGISRWGGICWSGQRDFGEYWQSDIGRSVSWVDGETSQMYGNRRRIRRLNYLSASTGSHDMRPVSRCSCLSVTPCISAWHRTICQSTSFHCPLSIVYCLLSTVHSNLTFHISHVHCVSLSAIFFQSRISWQMNKWTNEQTNKWTKVWSSQQFASIIEYPSSAAESILPWHCDTWRVMVLSQHRLWTNKRLRGGRFLTRRNRADIFSLDTLYDIRLCHNDTIDNNSRHSMLLSQLKTDSTSYRWKTVPNDLFHETVIANIVMLSQVPLTINPRNLASIRYFISLWIPNSRSINSMSHNLSQCFQEVQTWQYPFRISKIS
jgi:hypothetical protein